MKRFLFPLFALLLVSTIAVGFTNSNVTEKASYCVVADQVDQVISVEENYSVVSFTSVYVEPAGYFLIQHPDLGHALTDYSELAEKVNDVVLPVDRAPPRYICQKLVLSKYNLV